MYRYIHWRENTDLLSIQSWWKWREWPNQCSLGPRRLYRTFRNIQYTLTPNHRVHPLIPHFVLCKRMCTIVCMCLCVCVWERYLYVCVFVSVSHKMYVCLYVCLLGNVCVVCVVKREMCRQTSTHAHRQTAQHWFVVHQTTRLRSTIV